MCVLTQAPVFALHESVVQALLSSQFFATCVQPVAGAQASVVQALLSLQSTALPGWQLPEAQTSPVVHALPSLQGLVLNVLRHAPLLGLQVSVVQTLLSLQFLAVPVQVPVPSQLSLSVHWLPSLH